MLVLDNNGKLFDDRRRGERRKNKVEVEVERRQAERRNSTKNVKHQDASIAENSKESDAAPEAIDTNTDSTKEN